jgi:Mn2+/Fe2+ NRAMP family transporter
MINQYKKIFAAAISYVFTVIMLICSISVEEKMFRLLSFSHFVLALLIFSAICIDLIEEGKNVDT